MQFVTTWRGPADDQFVYFHQSVLDVFERHIQSDSGTEAGGILLGHVRGKHLEVLEASEPTLQDRRLRYFFERMIHGHKGLADRRWRESNGLVRYVGEWHTHPQDLPSPSGTDLCEWQILARNRSDRRPMLAVIVGRQNLHVELMQAGGKRHKFLME
ncbi:Mov34/MPN/PAD-1 family protein [Pseudomonas sp. URIL14HWK12:I6]|uniref:Mov34/MPN/PAD-1 family protein n=1 Tax=Pseudomonas sp. URIL14HWK12:I6 TaxID=1283293 RepID=UPI00047FC5E3|nr:Mov34/MPN/PAD-1 family protein [Pseudomonas sp. URIL14HWK12:I6]